MAREKRADRIRRFEAMMERVQAAVAAGDDPASVAEDASALAAYYAGPLWKRDYAADERGALPPDLKRGVLSQDGLYDLLADYDRLTKEER